MKPHGLDFIMKEEILENGKVIKSSESRNSFEAWVGLTNLKNGKYTEFPMRSFVNQFLEQVHGLLSGDAGEDTKLTSVSIATAASVATRAGLLIGQGTTPVGLSDTDLESQLIDASLAYGVTTFIAPVREGSGTPPVIKSEVRRLFSNNSNGSFYVKELGLFGKKLASTAGNAGIRMFSRDVVGGGAISEAPGSTPDVIDFVYDSDIRFDFKFKISHTSTGGLMLNFMKLIYNLMFKGSVNPTGSRIINTNSTYTTYSYGSASKSASSSFFYVGGLATQPYCGIAVGYVDDTPHDPGSGDPDYITPGNLTEDETTFNIITDDLTLTANTISAITSANKISKFSISRSFTNNGSNAIYIDRVGLLAKGTGTGITANATEFFMAVNTPTGGNVNLQPSQVYRITYSLGIQV